MDNHDINELIERATVGNLNKTFYARLDDDAKEFIDELEKQIKLGKDVSPSVVTTLLRENFGTKVDESTISKWQKRVKTS